VTPSAELPTCDWKAGSGAPLASRRATNGCADDGAHAVVRHGRLAGVEHAARGEPREHRPHLARGAVELAADEDAAVGFDGDRPHGVVEARRETRIDGLRGGAAAAGQQHGGQPRQTARCDCM